MRLYIDLSCFNRPFDDQGQERIRRETQAVFDVLRRIIEGSDTLVWSWVLSFENDNTPNPTAGTRSRFGNPDRSDQLW
jgi:hypothetical protein